MISFMVNQIEPWPLDRLAAYAANARTHSDDQVAQIAGSIAEFGFITPCLVDDDGVLIAGHGRVLAAQRLGLDTVPVIRVSHLSPAQIRAYRIADNRLVELGGWNDELLAAELHALNGDGFALDLLGFSTDELDALMAPLDDEPEEAGSTVDEQEPTDDVPEPPRKRSVGRETFGASATTA